MSSAADTATIASVSIFLASTYLETAVLTLFLYEFILMLPLEISEMWQKQFRLSTLLYFLMRYLPLAEILFYVTANTADPHCDIFIKFVASLSSIARASVAAALAIRTCAICKCHQYYILQVIICLLALATIGFDQIQVPAYTCQSSYLALSRWVIGNAIIKLTFEGTIILVTLSQIPDLKAQKGLKAFEGKSITAFLLTSGCLYFITVFMIELSRITFAVVAPDKAITGELALPLSAIVTSRFLLGIRALDSKSRGISRRTTFNFSLSQIRSEIREDFGNHHDIDEAHITNRAESQNIDSKLEEGLVQVSEDDIPVSKGVSENENDVYLISLWLSRNEENTARAGMARVRGA